MHSAKRNIPCIPSLVWGVFFALMIGFWFTLPVWADDNGPMAEKPTIARVLAVYSILASEKETVKECHSELISERDMLQREQDQQPWGLKYAKPLSAVGLGVASSVFYTNHMEGVISPRWKKWRTPFIAANAIEGYIVGPGPSIGGWAGAELGLWLSSGNLLAALAGDIVGSVLGGMAWNFLFPQHPALAPLPTDPDGDIPVEYFLKDKVCTEIKTRHFDAPQYRVEFMLDGVEFVADLPYDPGEALNIGADGTILGPSRTRLEE